MACHAFAREKGRIDPEKDFYSLNPYIEQLMDTIYSSIDELKTYALSFSLDPFLEKTPARFGNCCSRKTFFSMKGCGFSGNLECASVPAKLAEAGARCAERSGAVA